MKARFKKAPWALVILVLIALMLPLTVAAEEAPVVTEAAADVPAMAEGVGEPSGGAETDYTPAATLVRNFFREHAGSLASAATFLLTLFVTLICRRRIIPPLLDALSKLLGKSRETAEALAADHRAESEQLAALFGAAESLLGEAKEAAARAEAAVEAARQNGTERESERLVLREQVELLFELLMTANLPQYQKDRIGTSYVKLTAALGEGEHD